MTSTTDIHETSMRVEVSAWFQVWSVYSSYGESFSTSIDFDDRSVEVSMTRIYGKLDSSEVQALDALHVSTYDTLPYRAAALGDLDTWARAAAAAEGLASELRPTLRTLAGRFVEHLRLARPEFDVGTSQERGAHQPLGAEHSLEVRACASNRLGLNDPAPDDGVSAELRRKLWREPLFSWNAPETPPDFSALPLLRAQDFDAAVTAAAAGEPAPSTVLWADARDHRREGELKVAVILAITACETKFKEVATDRHEAGWQALLGQMARPTFGQARRRERVVFGTRYLDCDPAAHEQMLAAVRLRNDLIHNAFTTPDPTPSEVDELLAEAEAYMVWLDAR